VETVKEYIGCAENSYLIYTLTKYDASVKKQLANQKRYLPGYWTCNAISFRSQRNKKIIKISFTYHDKREKRVYYHKKTMMHFLIKEGLLITNAVQVTLSLKDETTEKRNQRITQAMVAYNSRKDL